MDPVYEHFKKIGEIEEKIEKNRIRMGDNPLKRRELQEKFDLIMDKIKKLNQDKEKLILENKELEQMILVLRDKIKEDKDYLLTVKSNDEYMMILEGISNKNKKIAESEEKVLKNLSEIEKIEQDINKLKEKDSTLENLKKEIEKINELLKDIENENKELDLGREKLVSELPEEYQKKYQRIYEKRKKRVVILVKEPYCLGCYSSIPAQLFEKIKSMKKIEFCINCGRILIYNKNESNDKI